MGEARKLRDLAPWLEFSSFFEPKVQELLLALRDRLPEGSGRAIDAYMVCNAIAEDPSRAIKHTNRLAHHIAFASEIAIPLLAELQAYYTQEPGLRQEPHQPGIRVAEASARFVGSLSDEEILRGKEEPPTLAPWQQVVEVLLDEDKLANEGKIPKKTSVFGQSDDIDRARLLASREKARREKILAVWQDTITVWQNSVKDPYPQR